MRPPFGFTRRLARFVGYAYRSLTSPGGERGQRLYRSPAAPVTALIDEGNQISRMANGLMQRLRHRASHASDRAEGETRAPTISRSPALKPPGQSS